MQHKKLNHGKKGISPIMAVLMMIVVAVAAGLVTYAWVMGYLDFTTANAGKSIKIQSIGYNASDTSIKVYVQNVGDGIVTLEDQKCLYVDGLLTTGTPNITTPSQGDISTISWDPEPDLVNGQIISIRVVTQDGIFNEATWTYND